MSRELLLRRHAFDLIGQLPESPKEALRVLQLAQQLVEGHLMPYDASAAGRISSLRAISSDSPAVSPSKI